MQDVKKAKCPRCREVWDPPDRYYPIADVKDGYLVTICPTCSLKSFNKACADEWKDSLPEDPLSDGKATHIREPKYLLT